MSQETEHKLRRNQPYYLDFIVFQVEDALFKLPKNHFATSSVFATVFTLPPGEQDVEGTEDKPFVLQGITEVDFVCLLKVMLPLPPLENVELTQQEWISVLKLSTMWEFTDIRAKAIQELSKEDMGMGTIKKIECARSFEVKGWLLEGYIELLKRAETITYEEAECLGWQTTAKLLLLREKYLSTINTQIVTCGGCRGQSCSLYTFCDRGRNYSKSQQVTDRNQHNFTYDVKQEFRELGVWLAPGKFEVLS